MLFPLFQRLQVILGPHTAKDSVLQMLSNWSDDTFDFVRHQMPRIVGVLIIAFILTRLLKAAARHLSNISESGKPALGGSRPAVAHAFQRDLQRRRVHHPVRCGDAGLASAGHHMGPLLASAGIAGLAVGFGAQTLVHDFINGFVILVENQYDIGDTVRIAGVQGPVEPIPFAARCCATGMGPCITFPAARLRSSAIFRATGTQLALHVSVDYGAEAIGLFQLLKQIGNEWRPIRFFGDDAGKPEVPGIDKVSGDDGGLSDAGKDASG